MLKIVDNHWAVWAQPRTPLGSSQRSSRPFSWRGGGLLPLSKNPNPDFGLDFRLLPLGELTTLLQTL